MPAPTQPPGARPAPAIGPSPAMSPNPLGAGPSPKPAKPPPKFGGCGPRCPRECILPEVPDQDALIWLFYAIALLVCTVVVIICAYSLFKALPGLLRGLRKRIGIGRRMAGPRDAKERRLYEKAQELRQKRARQLAYVTLFIAAPFCLRELLISPSVDWDDRRWLVRDGFLGAICLPAMMALFIMKPALVKARFLDRLNVTFNVAQVLYLVFVSRTMYNPHLGRKEWPIVSLGLYNWQGLVLGNARLTILLSWLQFLFGTMVNLAGHEICCLNDPVGSPDLLSTIDLMGIEVITAPGIHVFFTVLFWLKEKSEYDWAEIVLQAHATGEREILAKRLLSGMCDACAYLGPELDIAHGADQIGKILGKDAVASGKMIGTRFIELIAPEEADRVSDFISSYADEVKEQEGQIRPITIQTKMKDGFGVAVPVELFHASLSAEDGQIHVVGIREEQDRFTFAAQRRELAKDMKPTNSDADDSSNSSVSDNERSGSVVPLWYEKHDMYAIVDVSGDDDDFCITEATVAFQMVLGLQMDPGGLYHLTKLLGSDTLVEKFEEWVHGLIFGRTEEEKRQASPGMRFVFRHPGLEPHNIQLSAVCSLKVLEGGQFQLTLANVRFEKIRSRPRLARGSKPEKKREKRTAGSGTPREPSTALVDAEPAESTESKSGKGFHESL